MTRPLIVRLRFHAVSPDGRQGMPVTVDVPVQSSGVPVSIVAATFVPSVQAFWGFPVDATTDGVPDPAMKIGGVSPVFVVQIAPSVLLLDYPGVVSPGDVWSVDAALTHVASTPGIAWPESGIVVTP